MIAKCIAVLAIVAQINASMCGCGSSSVVLPSSGCGSSSVVLPSSGCGSSSVVLPSSGCGSSSVVLPSSGCGSSSVVLPSSGCCSQSSVLATSGASSRNIVAKGKYPVALNNCGPMPCQQIPVTISRVTAPVQEKPVVRLPAKIPAPRTVCHTCTCYKTIVRPRVHQQIITVPTVQRYIETLHKPVIENVQYEALPVNCGGATSSSSGLMSVGTGSVCGSSVQAIQVPSSGISCAQQVQVPVVQAVSSPCAQAVSSPCAQVISSPCAQAISSPCAQAVSSPCVQAVQSPCVQAVQSPCVQAVQSPCVQSVQVPVYQSSIIPSQCEQRIEIPQTISMGCRSQCSC